MIYLSYKKGSGIFKLTKEEQDKTKELKNMKSNQISLNKSRQLVNKFKNLLINKDDLKIQLTTKTKE